jgi:SAM-dependent methyltransferase
MRKMGNSPPVPATEQIGDAENFFQEWAIYQKMESHNYLCHREVYALLHQFLLTRISHPFVFLDLGCGDAGFVVSALKETGIRRYIGVDLGNPALELAKKDLARLGGDHLLVEQDFFEFVQDTGLRAEVIWMGLAFHHLPQAQKATFLHLVRRILPEDGYFMMYEPTLLEDENREQYLARSWVHLDRVWLALSPEELEKIKSHISHCDFPEKFSLLRRLALQNGFSGVSRLFQDPGQFFSLMCFRA